MPRDRKKRQDRSSGFNVSMPNLWIDVIDIECEERGIDRSVFIREAVILHMPILKDPEKLKKYLLSKQ